jgi:outer membrane protein assembly factor BamB
MSSSKKNKFDSTVMWYNIAKRIVLITAIFALILSILMVANFIQTKSIDPLNSQALNQLMLELQKNPENADLKDQIRAIDLLARRAYFTHQWQIRTGSILLFVSVLMILISLKYMNSLRSKLPDLEEQPGAKDSWESRIQARKYITFSGLILFALALVLGFISESELNEEVSWVSTDEYPTLDEIRQNSPNFRGPEGIGISYQTGFPTEWNGTSGQNIIWKIPLQKPGFNSPIVWGTQLFLSGADKTSQVVYCIDIELGRIVWQVELNDIAGSPTERPKVTRDTGYAAPTMSTDGYYVYVIFATGDIACLDFKGNRIWTKNLGVPKNHYGHSSSLINFKSLLLIQFDHNKGKQLIALKSQTGDMVYNTTRDVQISWASPIVVNTGKMTEVILTSNPHVISYNPENGRELWRVKCMDGEVAPSPAYADQMIFVVNEYARLAAIKLGERPTILWEYDDELSEVSSPVATSDLVFLPSSYGTVSCFDSKTGEIYWMHEFDEGFYSSPIIVEDLVYLMDRSGVIQIFKAAKEFQLAGQASLGEKAMTIPAFKDGRIYIRGEQNLYCIGNKDG